MKDNGLHYKVICVSLYNKDLAAMDEAITKLKKKGCTRANRSLLIRVALAHVLANDCDRVGLEHEMRSI